MKMQLKYIEDTLAFISENGYETNHAKFLKSTVIFLAKLFNVNYVLIDKFSIKKPSNTETVALFGNGSFLPNMSYNLEHTPCQNVINNKTCCYPKNVKALFPKDDLLAKMNVDSYIGIPLWSSNKEPIGLIALMDNKPIIEEKNIEIVLGILAVKVEEVLEKMFFEEQLNLKIEELNSLKEIAEESEQKLKEAQQIAHLGHWEQDIVNNKLTWSDEVFRIFELKPQEPEASEDLFMNLVHPDDISKYEKVYSDALINKTPWEIKYRLLFNSGKIKHILGNGFIEFNDNGEPTYSIGTILDITPQVKIEEDFKKAKEKAEKNEDKYRKLSNLIFEGIVISKKEGVALECNDIFLKMFGYSRKEIIGKNIIKLLFPDKYHEQIIKNRLQKHTLPFEVEGIRKDGTFFSVEIEGRDIDLDNKSFNRLVSFRDITLRKQAQIENKKRIAALEQSANTIIITDTHGNIEYTNPKFTEITGYTAAEALGKNPKILNSGTQTKAYYAKMWQTITEGKTWEGEFQNKAKNGTLFWEHLTISPIKDDAGNIINYLAIKEDITEYKKAEENLKESEKKYRFLFENNPQPMWIYDLETLAFLEVNKAAIQHYGYTREEFLAMTLKDIRPKEEVDTLLKDIEIAKRVGYNPAREWMHLKKSGEIINVNIVSHKVTLNNREARHILVNDITATKKAEQALLKAKREIEKSERKFRELFEKSGDAILIIKNGIFTECNKATLDMLGYKNYEDVLNLPPSKLSPEFQPDGLRSDEKANELINIALIKGTYRFEWWHTKSNGETFPVEVLLTTIENEPNNQVIHCIWRDITERKHAANELLNAYEIIKDRENFVSKIIETANEGFWLIDENANTIDVNTEMCKILGRPEIEIKEKSIYDFVDEHNYTILKKQIKIRKKGEPSVYEIELLNANGINVPCLLKTSPTFNKKKEVSGSFALVSDITNLKATFQKVENQNFGLKQLSNELSEKNRLLIESKDRFINLFEQNPIPLWEQDFSGVIKLLNQKKSETKDLKSYLDKNPDFVEACAKKIKILNANNAALELFGVKNIEELKIHLGKTNSKKVIDVLKKELVSIGSNKKTFSDETELIGKEGSNILARIKSVIIDDYGTSIASVIDITEAKNAENKLKETQYFLLESQKIANIGSYELDFSTGFWKSSPALNDIFGIDEKYIRNINGWLGIVHPEDKMMMVRYFEKNIMKNKESFNKEYRIIRNSDKQIRWVQGMGKLEFNNYGNPKRLFGTTQDISEKRQILQDIIIAKEKAEESGRLKTEFIQNMSHEIRTPMNGILGFSELLDNPDLTEEKRKRFIEIIKNSTHQLLHIIDDIMEISVLETKQIIAEENPACLNDLLCELFTIFNIKATKKNIKLVLKNELPDQESTILTDKIKLNKVLSNLLENALKFTDEGSVELGYKLNKDSEPAELEIYVKDSGIGIKPEKQKLIFDRFSQAEKDLSKKVGGLGLGLSIAKENTELLGGKISVVSELGEGAAFFVTIPYKPVNMIPNITIEKVKTTKENEKCTILIAEDEEVNFMVLEILLEDKLKLPCTIIHAEDGLEAVELCKNNSAIELVLMDIKMPKMDGHEATKRIKEFRPNLPIIAQTAYSTPEEKEKAFLAGCDDFISKPISKDALNDVINTYLLKKK
ncbi:MAG: PAS domain S-box protein [Lutibacter sp.]